MMLATGTTIAAIATANGHGGIAIVRVSGAESLGILRGCFSKKGESFDSHRLYYGHVVDREGQVVDEAMAVYMRAPHSYTREDVAEIHCHGGSVQARRVLSRVLALGAKAASPGEFTYRAFVNGRVNLSEAEAVMSLISAGSEASARASMRELTGGVSSAIHRQADRLVELLALIEAGDDFPEEIEEQATAREVQAGIVDIKRALIHVSNEKNARVIRDGLHIALLGRPNTGKSSILNALVGGERAIVTEHAGTTRDLITEQVMMDGFAVTLIDTAGQRHTSDPIEKIGVERARQAGRSADVKLLVIDGSAALTDEDRRLLGEADSLTTVVVNKCDLPPAHHEEAIKRLGVPTFFVSAVTGEGIADLEAHLTRSARAAAGIDGQLTLARHLDLAHDAIDSLSRAETCIHSGLPIDICAVDLGQALHSLLTITGESASEMVIEQVFASFCVGK